MAEYTPSELAVELADEWLDSHRKSDTWRIVDMLRDEVVRLAAAEHRATRAEARIKAVEDVLEESEARGPVGMTFNGTPFPAWISIATVRRALTA